MRIHILGICGTFMSGIAVLAKHSGHEVTGSDTNVYPPMSTQLREQGITLMEGYDPAHIDPNIDCVIVGNVIKRGNPAMESILENDISYLSGPAWLYQHVLKDRSVLAVAGTHGKTTTSSLLAWVLEHAGLQPGFLIGGGPDNFAFSARLGNSQYFVIEADEYDSAFFDKRSKFLHYHPKTLILNNLEYDHADIFPDLDAIKRQFHYLVRIVPRNGFIVRQAEDANLTDVLAMGCWTPVTDFGLTQGEWRAELIAEDGSAFSVFHHDVLVGEVHWSLLGKHNVMNALAVIAACTHAGVDLATMLPAFSHFKSVKRRMEKKGEAKHITVYDDFAHHPTAIATTLAGLRANIGSQSRLIAVVEFGSYTMRTGTHKNALRQAFLAADMVVCQETAIDWGLKEALAEFKQPVSLYDGVDQLVAGLVPLLCSGDHVVVMSNSSFGNVHQKLLNAIEKS